MRQTIDPAQLERYFTEEVSPAQFLESLHSVIVEHIRLAGRFDDYAQLEDVARAVDFLASFYDTVKAAVVPLEEEG